MDIGVPRIAVEFVEELCPTLNDNSFKCRLCWFGSGVHNRPLRRLSARRSRFDGLLSPSTSKYGVALRSSARCARNSLLASVSRYSVCATAAGPRISLSNRICTWNSPASFLICNRSPTRTSRDGLAFVPLLSILPSSQARAASDRVLKNRAAHNHLSILTPVIAFIFVRAAIRNVRNCIHVKRQSGNESSLGCSWRGQYRNQESDSGDAAGRTQHCSRDCLQGRRAGQASGGDVRNCESLWFL